MEGFWVPDSVEESLYDAKYHIGKAVKMVNKIEQATLKELPKAIRELKRIVERVKKELGSIEVKDAGDVEMNGSNGDNDDNDISEDSTVEDHSNRPTPNKSQQATKQKSSSNTNRDKAKYQPKSSRSGNHDSPLDVLDSNPVSEEDDFIIDPDFTDNSKNRRVESRPSTSNSNSSQIQNRSNGGSHTIKRPKFKRASETLS